MATRNIPTQFELARNAFGRLLLTQQDGSVLEGVTPVRAFPIQSAEVGVAMVDGEGHEVAWVDQLNEVGQPTQRLIREELLAREFMPEIQEILSVTSFATPCSWKVRTNRGETRFVLKGGEDIRRLVDNTLLVTDSHSIQFLIRDLAALSIDSKKILDRFM